MEGILQISICVWRRASGKSGVDQAEGSGGAGVTIWDTGEMNAEEEHHGDREAQLGLRPGMRRMRLR